PCRLRGPFHASLPKTKFAADSALEGAGFEPSVPRQEKWSMPSSSDQTRVGRTLTLGGGAEPSLEGRDIELSVSPKDIRTSPYDLCANRSDRRQSREGDRWFESISLQQRVRCEPDPRERIPSVACRVTSWRCLPPSPRGRGGSAQPERGGRFAPS